MKKSVSIMSACLPLKSLIGSKKTERRTTATNTEEFNELISTIGKNTKVRVTLKNGSTEVARTLLMLDRTGVTPFINPALLRGLMDFSGFSGMWIDGANPVDIILLNSETGVMFLKQVSDSLEKIEVLT